MEAIGTFVAEGCRLIRASAGHSPADDTAETLTRVKLHLSVANVAGEIICPQAEMRASGTVREPTSSTGTDWRTRISTAIFAPLAAMAMALMTMVASGATGPSEKSWLDGDGDDDGDGDGDTEVTDGECDEATMLSTGEHPPNNKMARIEISAGKDFIFGNLGHVNEHESTRE